jgi:hypothetical protein
MPALQGLGGLLVVGGVVLYVWFLLLPLFIYWRCGRILRRLERLEHFLGTEER